MHRMIENAVCQYVLLSSSLSSPSKRRRRRRRKEGGVFVCVIFFCMGSHANLTVQKRKTPHSPPPQKKKKIARASQIFFFFLLWWRRETCSNQSSLVSSCRHPRALFCGCNSIRKKIRTCCRECPSIPRHHRRFWSWKCTPLSVLRLVSRFAPRCSRSHQSKTLSPLERVEFCSSDFCVDALSFFPKTKNHFVVQSFAKQTKKTTRKISSLSVFAGGSVFIKLQL